MPPRGTTLALAALLAAAHAPGTAARQTITADDAAHVSWMGRPFPGKRAGAVGFQWLASGARVAHNGTVLRAQVMATARSYKLTFSQKVGNYLPVQGATWVTPSDAEGEGVVIASGAGEAVVNLNMPPQYFADQVGDAGIVSFTTDGSFLPAPPRSPRVLQFIGDSITAATNVVGGIAPGGCADAGYAASWAQSWSGILCNYFDADCTTVAVGGKGLVRNCCDDGPKMPDYYLRTKYTDSGATFDFSKDRVPDAVLVYLGTNDYNAGENKTLDAEFTAAYLALMHNITQVWYGTPAAPANVTFFATLGPMSPTLPSTATVAAVQQGRAAGFNVVLLNVTTACGPELAGCTDGCHGHPGVLSHRNMAVQAIPVMEPALGWGPS